MKFKTIQTRFTKGEIDPLMLGRVDVDQYYGAAEYMRNAFTLPQGGFKRRPGLEYIGRFLGQLTLQAPSSATAPNGGTASNGYDDNTATVVLTTTNISTTNPYVVLRYDLGAAYSIGVVYLYGLKLSAAGSSSEFYVQVSTNDTNWVTCGSALTITETGKNYSRRVHGSYRYVRLVRIGSTDLGTRKVEIGDMLVYKEGAISAGKIINFEFNKDQVYAVVVTDKNFAIYKDGVYQIDIRQSDYTYDKIPEIDWLHDADTLLIYHGDVQTKRLTRGSDHDIWTVSTITYTNIPTYDFGSGAVSIWSSTYGWPRHGTIYQGRIWVDGGKSRPTVVYGSKVNSLFDYSFGTAADDDAIGPLSFEGYNNIESIYAGRALMVFTSGGEYILPQPLGDPLTPTTTTVSRQSKIGSESYLRPQETEGGVLYIQRGGRSVQVFEYTDTTNSFSSGTVSLLSSHLVNGPVDYSLRKSTSTEEGNYLMLVLGDGSLTIANVLLSQGISSFTKQTTDGLFLNCAAIGTDMYVSVQRTINGSDVVYLEKFNNDHYTDASTRFTTGLPSDTFTATQLKGEVCRVLADGALQDNETPDASTGSFTIGRNAEDSLEIGLNFDVLVKDLPVENSQIGTVMGMPINISEITLRLYETAGIIINGKTQSFIGFGPSGGGSPLDATPPRFTGIINKKGWRGWTDTGQIEITQIDPLPMTVLVVSKKVRV